MTIGMKKAKDWIKSIHGIIYIILLPLIVRPPGRLLDGVYTTENRRQIIEFIEKWKKDIRGEVLDIGVGTWTWPRQILRDQCNYTSTDCFQDPNIDIVSDIHRLDQAFPPEAYDFILCTDVFEHISRPWEATRQIYKLLKPGGILLLTTPFNYHLHGDDKVLDYWRISAAGLRHLLIDEAGFIEVNINAIGHSRFPFGYQVVAIK